MAGKEEIKELMKTGESDRIEKTISKTDTDKYGKAICAFANDLAENNKPGYLLIGVKDNGELEGFKIDDPFLQTLADFRSDGRIVPPPSMNVQKYSYDDGDIAVVEVFPSPFTPVRYKNTIYVRTGARQTTANPSDERRLNEKRDIHAKTFDVRPCLEAELKDIETSIFLNSYLPNAVSEETIEENNRDIAHQLASLKFFDTKKQVPTHAALLMFGINVLFYIPGAYIQYIRFKGRTDDSEILSEKKFSGDLTSMLGILEDFIKFNIIKERTVRIDTKMQETHYKNYPLFAIREFLMNAIIHRDYESNSFIKMYHYTDRLVISNPGGLYGHANADNFPEVNDYRNPALAESMKNLGYVNRFNIGVKRAISELEKNGNPSPQFIKDKPSYFQVTIYPARQ